MHDPSQSFLISERIVALSERIAERLRASENIRPLGLRKTYNLLYLSQLRAQQFKEGSRFSLERRVLLPK